MSRKGLALAGLRNVTFSGAGAGKNRLRVIIKGQLRGLRYRSALCSFGVLRRGQEC